MHTLNLGILAHVDAGKTTLTERLLFDTGTIDRLGRVDDGTSATDTMSLERLRGITIRTSVASFTAGDLRVNLVDTPGHPDFIAEVERALAVLDGAILVLSAVEGVQAQSRLLMRALHRLRLPTILFINKIDRTGADPDRVRQQIAHHLRPEPGTAVLCGSARRGDSIDDLLTAIARMAPAPGDAHAALSATIFSIDAGGGAWVRVHNGVIRTRDRLGPRSRITAIRTPGHLRTTFLSAGDIGVITGLDHPRVGDRIGADGARPVAPLRPTTLETVVDAADPRDRGKLIGALSTLSDQDPLINLRLDDARGELRLSLHGEVQREVIAARLAEEFGVVATFQPLSVVCVERVTGSGLAHETIAIPPNPYLATVGLRIDPAPVGSGVDFALDVEAGSMPPAFFASVQAAVEETLHQGLYGWQVTDCVVTMTHSGYWSRQSHSHATFDKSMSSTAGDFRLLTPAVLMRALRAAGTVVCEPVDSFRLDLLPEQIPALLGKLAREEAEITGTDVGEGSARIEGVIPTRLTDSMQRRLPDLTSGEGVWESRLDHYRAVRGRAPRLPRVGVDPGDWAAYVKAHPR
ncbi:elongation factor G [Flexivirga caeni]|uniref:GTP-binding protein n=1 Tax=Flexivirga caeni TaxID=2294115 RepID=A0A3M9MK93_9MICO|nr:TetM/TetW/TetO/TetS family tetracycline resistance ribosomal protection protein [Flexivirga caeni]RNI25088.1 GTP-binding protein [Flexivirga caeni]